ncbi:hypothetical protein PILCRDRAFT_10734 [Piloderma croceum F 1598]|uniref:Uncharacterized protein n=1 Tax=Piloderma croceum (strain F 1598) TaxID=765440 RepID=A0A0C3FGJ1_PILCF|nr:hypothetical protein PILCRDRAFT_10734 [Piloderma croceum F 1598]
MRGTRHGRGIVTPRHPPPPHAVPLQPETERRQLGFGFFGPPALRLAFREHTTPPPPPPPPPRTRRRTAPAHCPPSPFRAARPKSSHNGLVSGFGPTPLPGSHFMSAQLHHHHHHLIRTTTLPLRTIPCRCFTRRALNRATTAQFRDLAQPPSLAPISRAHSSTTTTITSYAPPHCPYAPSPVAVSHGTP